MIAIFTQERFNVLLTMYISRRSLPLALDHLLAGYLYTIEWRAPTLYKVFKKYDSLVHNLLSFNNFIYLLNGLNPGFSTSLIVRSSRLEKNFIFWRFGYLCGSHYRRHIKNETERYRNTRKAFNVKHILPWLNLTKLKSRRRDLIFYTYSVASRPHWKHTIQFNKKNVDELLTWYKLRDKIIVWKEYADRLFYI